jgi:putative tryptophan/tyrosine transport system substrate-binding protein
VKRRDVITLLGGAVAIWPLAARAQQPVLPVIGVLAGVSAAQWAERMAAFHRGLVETGYVEGRNVAVEYRWAEGQLDRMPAMAADLVSRGVAVIFVTSDVGIQAAITATKTIPIVFSTASDPVAAGFVQNLARPGGNVTGITSLSIELIAKRLEVVHELLPGATRIAVLVNPANPGVTQNVIEDSQAAVEAGLPKGTAAHGFRKAACRRLAEAGCSASEIMAISGHKSLSEVQRYCAAADQARMARAAQAKASNAFGTEKETSSGKP